MFYEVSLPCYIDVLYYFPVGLPCLLITNDAFNRKVPEKDDGNIWISLRIRLEKEIKNERIYINEYQIDMKKQMFLV